VHADQPFGCEDAELPADEGARVPADGAPPVVARRAIKVANARAIRALSQPGSVVGPEKPYPGRDGTTT